MAQVPSRPTGLLWLIPHPRRRPLRLYHIALFDPGNKRERSFPMPSAIVAFALFAALMAVDADADAETEAERLAEMFSPILILTEKTGGKWGDTIVTKPEPVGMIALGASTVAAHRLGPWRKSIRRLDQNWTQNLGLVRYHCPSAARYTSPDLANRDRMAAQLHAATAPSESAKKPQGMSNYERVLLKFGTGALFGGAFALAMQELLPSRHFRPYFRNLCDQKENHADAEFGCAAGAHLIGLYAGYVLGLPLGVSIWDSEDQFLYSLTGSFLGASAAMIVKSELLLIPAPLFLATLASEASRNSRQARGLSIALVPSPELFLAFAVLRL